MKRLYVKGKRMKYELREEGQKIGRRRGKDDVKRQEGE